MRIFLLLTSLVLGLLQARQSAAFAPPASLRSSSIAAEKQFGSPALKPPSARVHKVPHGGSQNRQNGVTTLQVLPAAVAALPSALAVLPLSQKICLSCLLPSCLGFWKTEYGVSYAYGSATALTSFVIYKELIKGNSLAAMHAGSLFFYGVRLCAFLAYRQLTSRRIKEIQQRIEEKAQSRGGRMKRAPFVLSVAALYFGLCAPLLISSRVTASNIPAWTAKLLKGLVATTWGGFIFAALGDLNKTLVKTIKGEDHLVTGGLFSFCRHPNYTGEIVAWTANGLIAVIAAAASQGAGLSGPKLVGYLLASVMGAFGLDFVLVGATKGLEKKQREAYGGTEEYKKWVGSSWCGFELPWSDAADEIVDPHVTPEIEFVDSSEETGSGI